MTRDIILNFVRAISEEAVLSGLDGLEPKKPQQKNLNQSNEKPRKTKDDNGKTQPFEGVSPTKTGDFRLPC